MGELLERNMCCFWGNSGQVGVRVVWGAVLGSPNANMPTWFSANPFMMVLLQWSAMQCEIENRAPFLMAWQWAAPVSPAPWQGFVTCWPPEQSLCVDDKCQHIHVASN